MHYGIYLNIVKYVEKAGKRTREKEGNRKEIIGGVRTLKKHERERAWGPLVGLI